MKLNRVSILSLFMILLTSCASQPSIVKYKDTGSSSSDWFPIPSDAPSSVEVTEIVVPRITPEIISYSQDQIASSLIVEQLVDSLGNASLVFNRSGSATWELVEQALVELEYSVADRNRDEYRIELAKGLGKGSALVDLFGKKSDRLNLILIPHDRATTLVVEKEGDELPESDAVASVLEPILDYFQALK